MKLSDEFIATTIRGIKITISCGILPLTVTALVAMTAESDRNFLLD